MMATASVAGGGELSVTNPTNEQLLKTYRIPSFSPPYPVNINPNFSSEVTTARIVTWLEGLKVNSILSPELFKRIVDMDSPALAARVYSDAMEPELEWACKMFVMTWIWDDILDETETGESPETAAPYLLEVTLIQMWSFPDAPELRAQLQRFLSYLEGHEREQKTQYIESVLAEARAQPGTVYPKPATSVLCNLYLDVWKELVGSGASDEFCLRHACAYQFSYNGFLDESKYRKSKTIPSSIEEYIQMRRGSSVVYTTIAPIDFIYRINTPDKWYYSPETQALMSILNDILSWHNDIWSFKMEVLEGKERFNMVHMVSTYQKVSVKEAAEISTQMLYDRLSDLDKAAEALQSITPPEYQRNLDIYLLTARNWVSGTHDWHSKCVRYK